MDIDLQMFSEELGKDSAVSHLMMLMAPRAEIVQALVASPRALEAARALPWDSPSVRVRDMVAEADAKLARRAMDAATCSGMSESILAALELRQLLMRSSEASEHAMLMLADDPVALLALRESVPVAEDGEHGGLMVSRVCQMLARVDAHLARRAMDAASGGAA